MPRHDYVQACVDSVEKTPPVVDSTIRGITLQNFLIKQRFTLYGEFCQHMVGLQHPVTGKCVRRLSDVDSRLMAYALNPQKQIKQPIGEYSVNESYLAMKIVHEFAMDPNGLQVANYVGLITKCIYVARQLGNERIALPRSMDDFSLSFSGGSLETCKNFVESLARSDGEAMEVLRKFSERRGRLAQWGDRERLRGLFPRFSEQAKKFCTAQRKKTNATLQTISKHFAAPQVTGSDLPHEFSHSGCSTKTRTQ